MISKTKTLILPMLVLTILTMFASLANATPICPAGTSLCGSIVSSPVQTNHGTDVTISFNVTYEGTTTPAILDFSDTTSPTVGIWQNLPTQTSINMGETKMFSATLRVPANAVGPINDAKIKVKTATVPIAEILVPVITITQMPSLTLTTSGTLSQTTSANLVVRNGGNTPLNVVLSETSSLGVIFANPSISLNNLAPGASSNVGVSLPEGTNLNFGNNVATIKAEDSARGINKTATFTIKKTFCSAGAKGGNLKISNFEINNNGEGDDDEFNLLDEIEVELDIENNGNDEINDIIVEMGFFDSTGNNVVNDLDFQNADEEEIDFGDLNDGDEETVTFQFTIPADLEDGNYKLAVKAYSDDLGENMECIDSSSDLSESFFESLSVDRENDQGKFISFDNILFIPDQVTCGERATMTLDVYNIGDEDQDQVKILLKNREMNLDESIEIRSNLDQGDKESVSFDFLVPQGIADKIYNLDLTAEYDYSRGSYRESSDSVSSHSLKVSGCSPTNDGENPGTTRIASISAILDSDAQASKELVVRATITNLKTESATFAVDASGYESWASLDSISNRNLVIGSGDSRDVTFTFLVDDDASGSESFTIEVSSGSDSEERLIAVNIGEVSTGGESSGSIFSGFGDNTYLWIIGIINVVLVVLIIVVAVRISRR